MGALPSKKSCVLAQFRSCTCFLTSRRDVELRTKTWQRASYARCYRQLYPSFYLTISRSLRTSSYLTPEKRQFGATRLKVVGLAGLLALLQHVSLHNNNDLACKGIDPTTCHVGTKQLFIARPPRMGVNAWILLSMLMFTSRMAQLSWQHCRLGMRCDALWHWRADRIVLPSMKMQARRLPRWC